MLGASLDGVRVHREWEQVYLQDTYGVYALTSTLADLPRLISQVEMDLSASGMELTPVVKPAAEGSAAASGAGAAGSAGNPEAKGASTASGGDGSWPPPPTASPSCLQHAVFDTASAYEYTASAYCVRLVAARERQRAAVWWLMLM